MKKIDGLKGIQWIGFSLLFAGAAAKWLHLDPTGIILDAGLILFSLFFFGQGLTEKAHFGFGRHNLKLIAQQLSCCFLLKA